LIGKGKAQFEISCAPAKKTAGKPEELDFIPPKDETRRTGINYDIKYRMGKELSSDDED